MTGEQDKGIAPRRAQQIIEVLDAKGLFVQLEELPTKLEHVDADGKARLVLSPKEPDIFVERVGDRWLWSSRTVARIPEIYRSVFVVDTQGFVRQLPKWMQSEALGMAIWQFLALLGLVILGLLVRIMTRGIFGVQTRITMWRLKVNPDETLTASGIPWEPWWPPVLRSWSSRFLLPVQINQLVLWSFAGLCDLRGRSVSWSSLDCVV